MPSVATSGAGRRRAGRSSRSPGWPRRRRPCRQVDVLRDAGGRPCRGSRRRRRSQPSSSTQRVRARRPRTPRRSRRQRRRPRRSAVMVACRRCRRRTTRRRSPKRESRRPTRSSGRADGHAVVLHHGSHLLAHRRWDAHTEARQCQRSRLPIVPERHHLPTAYPPNTPEGAPWPPAARRDHPILRRHRAQGQRRGRHHFADDGTVTDEETHQGAAAIRAWREGTASVYEYTTEIIATDLADDGSYVVTGRLDGNFPGGTAMLKWAFTLVGDRIAHLQIAP